MLHKTTINDSALELLIKLMDDGVLKDFVLVGGTALALQIGHRISVDIDLFSSEPFDENEVAEYLRANYHFKLDFISKNTLKGEINGVQLDCIAHQYPWNNPFHLEENIRLASFYDIAAMKLNAISGNGTRIKYFIDIAYLSSKIPLNKMLEGYEMKYNANSIIPIKAIAFFDDINFNEPIKMSNGLKFNWVKIEKRLKSMQDHPDRIFPALN
ncbi:MAG: nucleotidyl transferase AbiEii/AbiGii toxin family protein [Prolixibacteraceae bacterium]|nr:nucleotidyl transferase AbiEii/AbiGii toxin family protein [Prolixibacteraceae bacterium]